MTCLVYQFDGKLQSICSAISHCKTKYCKNKYLKLQIIYQNQGNVHTFRVSELETRLKVINYSPEIDSKTLLLKTPHTYFIEHEELQLETSLYLLVLVELCMLTEEKMINPTRLGTLLPTIITFLAMYVYRFNSGTNGIGVTNYSFFYYLFY